MVGNTNYYTVLGVSPDATPEEIKRAFRHKARQYHPDVNPEPSATAQFALITTAYEVLSHPAARADYDIRLGGYRRARTVEAEEEPLPWEEPIPMGMMLLRRVGLAFSMFFGLLLALVFASSWAAGQGMVLLAQLLEWLLIPTVAAGVVIPVVVLVWGSRSV